MIPTRPVLHSLRGSPAATMVHRLLDEQDGVDTGGEAYEFIAFLLWYIFLVICCVLPTCCAYRRRRAVEARLAQQHANMFWLQRSNLFILSNLQNRRNSEQVLQERTRILGEELKQTTMTMSGKLTKVGDKKSKPLKEEDLAIAQGIVDGMVEADHFGTVTLPTDALNGDRAIAGLCSICLCAYEEGEKISWSPKSDCRHAFHTECIIPWLAKKEEPKCPVCRQEFCEAAVVPDELMEMEEVSVDNLAGLESFLNVRFMRPREAAPESSEANTSNNEGRNADDAQDVVEVGLQDVSLDDVAGQEQAPDSGETTSSATPAIESLEVEQGGDDTPSR